MNKVIAIMVLICTSAVSLVAENPALRTDKIRIRDPFIYADESSKLYYMYAQAGNRSGSGFTGVEVYTSRDLIKWSDPQPVLKLSATDGVRSVWAPEMHEYNGAYYLFVTLTFDRLLPEKKPIATYWTRVMRERGTYIYRADSPAGPFVPLKKESHTPEGWMALDGTLFEEDGDPYMVFCHEWVQLIDGTMDVVRLKDDLSDTVGDPQLLFNASDAPGSITDPKKGKVTDGCFLYRSPKSGKLFMIWSTFLPGSDYCVMLTESESGKIMGPWINQKPIYKKNGGHGMLFRSFDGRLMMALHQPNSGARERLHLFEVTDTGATLEVGGAVRSVTGSR